MNILKSYNLLVASSMVMMASHALSIKAENYGYENLLMGIDDLCQFEPPVCCLLLKNR